MIESVGNILNADNAEIDRAGIQAEDFLRILLAQLSFQDPLKPLDNQEYVSQLAEFTNLEQTRLVGENLESLLTVQSSTQALDLIGRVVEVQTETGSQIGEVTTVGFQGGFPTLTVEVDDGSFLDGVSLSQIAVVR
ncbi:MAG: flagellar hook capping FlgD N-terminal domain-containing protein [Pseudomonadota bacterium]